MRNRRTVLSVRFTNDVGPVTSSGDPAQPSVRDLVGRGPGMDLIPCLDGIRNEMGGHNNGGDRVSDGGRVANVEAKGR